ncbi:hypothetical protein P5673_022290 [Acropora cervicornis]|uniref:Uncharacterized protein n=1 Tax=Acropora cervicornis TaxID=6130 RepID=A0AAD9Q6K4_ACRCE|nr:hypothetical protein P5673_022290 [Acropora cervicornis]
MASRSSRKWRFCQHCQEYVSGRTYREHYDLYFKKSSAQWRTIDSSDEEGSRRHEAHFDVLDDESFQSTSRLATVMMKMQSSGVRIHNLEEEDCHLLQGDTINCSDSDTDVNDFIYHKRIQPDFLTEAWDLADEDVDKDFP